MKKVFIKNARVLENGAKAELRFRNEGDNKDRLSIRALHTEERNNVVYFKGIKFLLQFNKDGNAENIIKDSIYDEGVHERDPHRFERYVVDLAVEEFPIIQKIKQEMQPPWENKQPEVKNVPKAKVDVKDVKHEKYETIKACIQSNVPVYLYGPAGSGKNHTLQQIADDLGLEFYYTNSVQQEYKITGFIDAGGNYHETEFYKAFRNGGVFFLDEMDASIPEVLVLLNAAIANGYFEFPNGKIDAHEEFRVVSAGNTVGTGADEQYTGRLQLDQATLDRFAMIEFDYDRNIELVIAKGNVELVDFVRGLRKQSKEKGIQATFSYRCISMVAELEGKLHLKEIIQIAIVKGLDQDTINTLQTSPSNKYSKALWMLKKAG